ncbi:MAG: hypothetical protein QF464_10820, partial [Myxococcota bacterium]|nr:hypothetical protein [Myxococcota bacterium]
MRAAIVAVVLGLVICVGPQAMGQSSNCISSAGDVFGSPLSITDVAIGPQGVLYAVDGERGH